MEISRLKGIILTLIAFAGFAAGNAIAAPIADILISGGFDMRNSGDSAVLAKFEQLTSNDYVLSDLTRNNSPVAVWDSGFWVIQVAPATPGYFLLKFGTGGTKTNLDSYFFQNTGNLNQLVFRNDQVNFLTGGDCANGNDNRCNISRLSHYVFVPGNKIPNGEVPEPGSLALLGLGIAGLMLRRRCLCR